jgi:putative RNA 2'-phosphotransferase
MKNLEKTSKFLSYVLRHKPEEIGLQLDSEGWADIQDLIQLANKSGNSLNETLIREVVETSEKKRFAISCDGDFIRANQGHSVQVDLGFSSIEPPKILFHGTADRFLRSIFESGLSRGNRHHVHLSEDTETASSVGGRYGNPVVLVVHAATMFREGFEFYRSENGVWLTNSVPAKYICVSVPSNSQQQSPVPDASEF